MMPMAPRARLALRLVGAVGTRTTFCDSSACMLATCNDQASQSSIYSGSICRNLIDKVDRNISANRLALDSPNRSASEQ